MQVDPKSGRNLKYEVFNFWKRQYSANLMSVCLVHNAELAKLQEIALEKLSLIPNKNIPRTIWRAPVFRRDQLGLRLYVVPVREVRDVVQHCIAALYCTTGLPPQPHLPLA